MLLKDFLNNSNYFTIENSLIPLRGTTIPYLLGKDLKALNKSNRDIMKWYNEIQYTVDNKKESFQDFFKIDAQLLRFPYWDVDSTMSLLKKDYIIHKQNIYDNPYFYKELYSKYSIIMNYLCESYKQDQNNAFVNMKYKIEEKVLLEAFAETCNIASNKVVYNAFIELCKKQNKNPNLIEQFIGIILRLNEFHYKQQEINSLAQDLIRVINVESFYKAS